MLPQREAARTGWQWHCPTSRSASSCQHSYGERPRLAIWKDTLAGPHCRPAPGSDSCLPVCAWPQGAEVSLQHPRSLSAPGWALATVCMYPFWSAGPSGGEEGVGQKGGKLHLIANTSSSCPSSPAAFPAPLRNSRVGVRQEVSHAPPHNPTPILPPTAGFSEQALRSWQACLPYLGFPTKQSPSRLRPGLGQSRHKTGRKAAGWRLGASGWERQAVSTACLLSAVWRLGRIWDKNGCDLGPWLPHRIFLGWP